MTDPTSKSEVSATGATLPPDPHEQFATSLIGTLIAGRYVVSRVLGKGGMGVVVVARYPELDQEVAIKLMFPMLAADGVLCARFIREGRVAAKVKSPHLVRVSDVGRLDGGVPYLVMELLAGHDLDHELAARGPLPIHDSVEFLLQTLTGVAELHSLGIVHRDLKPSNLFVTDVGGERAIKILDFGISKDSTGASGSGLTVTDSVIGTPSHMSPEQIKTPKEVDPRADIWSLGVILYELLTSRMPFELEGDSVGELFAHILFQNPIKPTARRADLPEGLEQVILRCLRRNRTERFANVAELAEALRPFTPPSALHRIEAVKRAVERTSQRPVIAAKASDPSPGLAEKETVAAKPDVAVVTPAAHSKTTPLIAKPAMTAETRVEAPSRSLATSNHSVPIEPTQTARKKTVFAMIGVAAVLIVGAIAYVGLHGPSSASHETIVPTSAGSSAAIVVAAPPSVASAAPSSPPAPAVSDVSTAIVLPTQPSHVASPTPPRAHPRSSSAPSQPAAPASAASPGLILDRK